MSDIGKLCYSPSSGSLAYKKSGTNAGSLIYKSAAAETGCMVKVAFGNQSWVCKTFTCYHEIGYSASGSGLTITSIESGHDFVTYMVKPNGSTSFVVSVTASTHCGALEKESPGATCDVTATQPGVSPKIKRNIACSPNTAKRTTITFDSNGKLTGIS